MVNLFEADVVAGEESTDGHAVSVPSDATVRTNEPGLEMAWVSDGFESLGEGLGAAALALRLALGFDMLAAQQNCETLDGVTSRLN